MTKFKVGDKVRWCVSYVDYKSDDDEPVEFGVVSDVFNSAVDVIFDLAKSDGGLYCLLDEIELVEDKSWPQVGDKGVWWGSVYTLVDDGKHSSWPYWKGKSRASWNRIDCEGYKPYYEEETEKGEDNMTEDSNQFVGTTKVIKEVINTLDSSGAIMSIKPLKCSNVQLTVGAEFCDSFSNCFNKRTLQELIHNLQEVCDLLEP